MAGALFTSSPALTALVISEQAVEGQPLAADGLIRFAKSLGPADAPPPCFVDDPHDVRSSAAMTTEARAADPTLFDRNFIVEAFRGCGPVGTHDQGNVRLAACDSSRSLENL